MAGELYSILKSAAAFREKSRESLATRMIIYGRSGVGKTHMLTTAPRPILIHSFDPGGCNIRPIQKGEREGWIQVDTRYEKEDPRNPKVWRRWDDEMERLFKLPGFWEQIGTFVIDSATTFCQSAMYESIRGQLDTKKGAGTGYAPRQDDYTPAMTEIENWIRRLASVECNLVLTGHDDVQEDKIQKTFTKEPILIGKHRRRLPLLLDEVYYLKPGTSATKREGKLQTFDDGFISAKTVLNLDPYEPPDIRALLKKGGRPYQDKPGSFHDGTQSKTNTEKKEENKT